MSRIDYITVGLVALCLAALIYILSKVAGIDKTPSTPEPETISTSMTAASDTLSVQDTSTISEDTLLNSLPQNVEEAPAGVTTEKRYLVVAASFPEESLALKERDRLIRLGYEGCEIGYFNQRKITSVIAARFDDYDVASAFAQKMNEAHQLEAYVHQKRLQ